MVERVKSLQAILDNIVDGKKVFGTSFAVKTENFVWHGCSGNFSKDQSYFIASTTKLFTTALVLTLRSGGKLNLNDRIGKYLDSSILNGLHIFKGKDYSEELTIKHLLAHTSGLPDYFQDKKANGTSLENEIKRGKDQKWTFEDVIDQTKSLNPFFPPGTPKKAHYSDVNFQLLGKISEIIVGKSFAEIIKDLITDSLNLTKTYIYQDFSDKTPKNLYFRNSELNIPKAMTSFGADGGMVSTSEDMLVFIEAFFSGKLFPSDYLIEIQEWNKIFFPMRSGVGIHLFRLPWIFNPTGAIPYFIGHSGLSGALAFYSPTEKIFLTGTVNQVAYPDLSFKLMIKLTQYLMKK